MAYMDESIFSYFWNKLKGLFDGKVDVETGKGLSANDFTDADKTKLDGIATGANKYSHPNSGATAGTYRSVTVNAQGHVTAGTNPTTLSGYGITDAAAKNHTHGNADITALDASKLTGTVPIDRLPKGALERLTVVADDTARFALTTGAVQLGDTVKVTATGKMYYVKNESKLNSEDGYEVYTAGSATSVPWSGVTGKPSTFTPSTHSHAVAQVTGLQGALDGKAASTDMTAATAGAAGTHGLVPAPAAGAQGKFLRGDGTWQTPTNTTYSAATTTAPGLMSAADKEKLDGVAEGANKYTHPTTAGNKHIPSGGSAGQILRWSAAGTAVWGADNNTTYNAMTGASGSAAGTTGLVPAPAAGKQNSFLRGDGTWVVPTDTKYNVATTSSNGLMSAADKEKLDGLVPLTEADIDEIMAN